MAAVTELADRLAMIRLLDAAIGPIKSRGSRVHGWAGAGWAGVRAASRGGLPGRAGPLPRRCGRAGARWGARVELDDRGRAGPAVVRRPVAGGGGRRRGWAPTRA